MTANRRHVMPRPEDRQYVSLFRFGFRLADFDQAREGNMRSLGVSLLGFLLWMDMSIKLPTNRIEAFDNCQRAIEVIDKKKLEQVMLDMMLQNLKSVSPEQKSLARVEVVMSCRPKDEVR
jgi:hypothetical protein